MGRNDVEDALKRLDKLTQEETRMATAEVLNNVKVLVDGIQSEFFNRTCCPNHLYRQMTNRQKQICNKRSVRHFSLLLHLLLEAQS